MLYIIYEVAAPTQIHYMLGVRRRRDGVSGRGDLAALLKITNRCTAKNKRSDGICGSASAA